MAGLKQLFNIMKNGVQDNVMLQVQRYLQLLDLTDTDWPISSLVAIGEFSGLMGEVLTSSQVANPVSSLNIY